MSRSLAERAVACKGWRLVPGMIDIDGVRFCTLEDWGPHGVMRCGHASMVRSLPDLDDPATLGCLLALVREAWGAPIDIEEFRTNTGSVQFIVAVHAGGDMQDPRCFQGGSLGSALVGALEASHE